MRDRKQHNREDLAILLERREEIVDRALLYAHLLSVLDQRRRQQGEVDAPAEADVEEACEEEDGEPPVGLGDESALGAAMLAEGGSRSWAFDTL